MKNSKTAKTTKTTKKPTDKQICDSCLKTIRALEKAKEKIEKKINAQREKLYIACNDLTRAQYVGKWLKINGLWVHETDTKTPTFETFRVLKCADIFTHRCGFGIKYSKMISIEHDEDECDSVYVSLSSNGNTEVHEEACIQIMSESEVIEYLNKLDIQTSNFVGECMKIANPDIIEQARKYRKNG